MCYRKLELFIYWLTPYTAATSRAGPSQEPGASSAPPKCAAGAQGLGQAISRELAQKWSSQDPKWNPNGM